MNRHNQHVRSINIVHQRVHNGQAFLAFHNHSSLGDGSAINIYMKTGNQSAPPHLIASISATDSIDFEILENPTVTANTGVNGVEIFNKRRSSENTSMVSDNASSPAINKIATDVTVTGDGTIIQKEVIGGKKQSINIDLAREWDLKANTAYVFRVTSRFASNRVHLHLDWYEPS